MPWASRSDHFLPQNRLAFAFSLRTEGESKPGCWQTSGSVFDLKFSGGILYEGLRGGCLSFLSHGLSRNLIRSLKSAACLEVFLALSMRAAASSFNSSISFRSDSELLSLVTIRYDSRGAAAMHEAVARDSDRESKPEKPVPNKHGIMFDI